MKKILTAVLTAAMLLPLLASCGGGKQGSDGKQGGDSGKEDGVPTIYVEGFSAMRNNENRQPSTDEAFKQMQDAIIEDIGVKVEPVFMPAGAETEKLNLRIASKSEPLDMVMSGNWMDLSKNKQIIPVNEYLDSMPNLLKAYPKEQEAVWAMLTDSETGDIYGFPRGLPTTSFPTWLRQDWLDKLGLELPKTVDELHEVLVAFKENDPAGNGQTIPLVTDLSGFNMGFSSGWTEHGYGYWLDPSDNKVKHGVMQPGYKDAVEVFAGWYEEGLIHPDSYAVKNEEHKNWLTSNRVAGTMKWYSLVAINEPTLQEAVPEALYAYPNVIEGPKGSIQTSGKPGTGAVTILSKSEHPEAVAKFVDWLSVTENYVSSYLGVKGTDWHWSDESKGYCVRDDDLRYGGEFYTYPNSALLKTYTIMPSDDITEADNYNHYLTIGSYRYDDVKKPDDYSILPKVAVLDKYAPNRADLDTMVSVEVTNFLTGARPMSEWDSFINDELPKAGLDDVITAYTELYKEQGMIK